MGMGRGTAASMAEGFDRAGTAAMGLGTAMMAGGGLIVGGMVASARAAANFQSQLVLLQTHAGATIDTMRQIGAYILKVAGQLGFDPTSLAQAVYHVQSSLTSLPPALQNAATDEEVLYRASQLAAIGHANLEDSVNAVTKAFVSYQKDGYTAQQITAIFNKTVGEGNMRLQELNAAFATGLLPVAEQAGIKLESIGAALATMTDLGLPAARASIYLRSAIIQMSIPSQKAADALTAIGVAANDTKSEVDTFNQVLVKAGIIQTDVAKELQKTGSLGDTLTWLNQKLVATGMSSKDAAALLDRSFGGIRSGTGVVALYNNLGGLVQKEKDATQATADWAGTWEKFTQQDPNFQLNQLKASWDSLVIVLGYSFLPVMLKVLQTITPIVQMIGEWVAKNSDLVASSVEGLAVFLLIGGAIVFVAGLMGKLIGFIIPIVQWFIELGSQMMIAGTAVDEFGVAAGSAGEVLGAAFSNPIGIAIAVIAALIAIGVFLILHWQQVKAVAAMVWGYVGPYVAQALKFIHGIIQAELGFILSVWKEHHAQFLATAAVIWNIIKVWFIVSMVIIAAVIAIAIIAIIAIIAVLIGLGAGIFWVVGKIMDLVGAISHFVGVAGGALNRFFQDLVRGVGEAWMRFYTTIVLTIFMVENSILQFWFTLTSTAGAAWAEFARHPAYWIGYVIGLIIGFAFRANNAFMNFFAWLVSTAYQQWTEFVNAAITWLGHAIVSIINFGINANKTVMNFFAWLVATAAQKWNEFFNIAMDWLARLPGNFWNIVSQLPGIFNNAMSWLITAVWNGGRWVVSTWNAAVSGLIDSAWNLGRSMASGIWEGLKSLGGWLRSQAAGFVAGLVQGMRDAILPGSPSMLAAMQIGVPLSQGIAMGMKMDMPNTQAVLNTSLTGLLGQASTSPSRSSSSVNINQNQQQSIVVQVDNDVLAKAVIRNVTLWRDASELI